MYKHNKTKYYRCGWLIDGSGSSVIENAIICVKNKFFDKVFKLDHEIIINSDIVDMSEYTILPCLIDSHVHLAFSGETNLKIRKYQLDKNYKGRNYVIAKNINQHLLSGIAAVRDCGDPSNDILSFKHHFIDTNFYVDILFAGMAWYKNGCYGSFIGNPLEACHTLGQSISMKGNNRDFIKIINSGLNSLSNFGTETLPQFRTYDIKLAVLTANLSNKKVAIHANGIISVKTALEAKCCSIEHGFFMGKPNMELMAHHSIFWVPTIFTMKASMNYLNKCNRLSEGYVASKNLEHQLEQLSIARKIGVVALGTDSGSPGVNHGFSIKEEIKLFIEAGYTLEEALSCATNNGAQLIQHSKIGLIKKGMKANFIVIKAKPPYLADSLDNIDHIFIEGRKIV